MIEILFVELLVVGGVAAAVKLRYNSCLAKIDVFSGLPAINAVSAVGMMRPHLVEVERF